MAFVVDVCDDVFGEHTCSLFVSFRFCLFMHFDSLSGFAATTMMLSCWNAGLLSSTTSSTVLPMALWYVLHDCMISSFIRF